MCRHCVLMRCLPALTSVGELDRLHQAHGGKFTSLAAASRPGQRLGNDGLPPSVIAHNSQINAVDDCRSRDIGGIDPASTLDSQPFGLLVVHWDAPWRARARDAKTSDRTAVVLHPSTSSAFCATGRQTPQDCAVGARPAPRRRGAPAPSHPLTIYREAAFGLAGTPTGQVYRPIVALFTHAPPGTAVITPPRQHHRARRAPHASAAAAPSSARRDPRLRLP